MQVPESLLAELDTPQAAVMMCLGEGRAPWDWTVSVTWEVPRQHLCVTEEGMKEGLVLWRAEWKDGVQTSKALRACRGPQLPHLPPEGSEDLSPHPLPLPFSCQLLWHPARLGTPAWECGCLPSPLPCARLQSNTSVIEFAVTVAFPIRCL